MAMKEKITYAEAVQAAQDAASVLLDGELRIAATQRVLDHILYHGSYTLVRSRGKAKRGD